MMSTNSVAMSMQNRPFQRFSNHLTRLPQASWPRPSQLCSPCFDAPEVARVRSETLAALDRERDHPEALLGEHLARAIYPSHRYGLDADGAPESVARFDRAAALAWQRRPLTPSNAILVAAGN